MDIDQVVGWLGTAAGSRIFGGEGEAWTYGWFLAEYRSRSDAAVSTADGPVRFDPEGVSAIEAAVKTLLGAPSVARRWEAEELWGVVADAVASLPRTDPPMLSELRHRVEALVDETPALVILSLANVDWRDEPMSVANAVIGREGETWTELVRTKAAGRPWPTPEELVELRARTKSKSDQPHILFGAWTSHDGEAAFGDVRRRVDDLFGIALLLAGEPSSMNLHPMRGDSHKPGIRGLTLHRPALRGSRIAAELGAEVAVLSTIGSRSSVHWYGEDPFPLDRLLKNAHLEATSIVSGTDPLSRRQRTAARWLWKAHWAFEPEDAALALGIGFDALLADDSGSPGRVLVERFALLEPDPQLRAKRASAMQRIYDARSSVAHGSASRVLAQPEFVRDMARDLRWVASRLRIVSSRHPIRSRDDHRELFDGLKWGTIQA